MSTGPAPTAEIYKDILSLDFKVCITTNYDQLIEKNFEHYSGGHVTHHVRTHTYKNFISDLRSPSRTILKLHGCVTNTAEIVLDRKSYFNAKADNPGIYDAVQALSTVNTVLFLGYSISDPDIQLILESVHARTRADHTHYALMSKFEHPSLRQAIGSTYNVSFIEYPAGQHHEVPLAVIDLWKAVKEERAGRGIP
ncbi:MAG: SIR2 family protein [Ensifer sp. SSB1]|nr:SIR2 family protein [Ensifer sp. SSB1]